MNDSKPYLLRALYEWICDNDCTPYLYIDTAVSDVLLPQHLYQEEPLVLNISPSACNQLTMANDIIALQARFSGKIFDISVPISAVLAIVARENGQGMTFASISDAKATADANEKLAKSNTTDNNKKTNKSPLKVVK